MVTTDSSPCWVMHGGGTWPLPLGGMFLGAAVLMNIDLNGVEVRVARWLPILHPGFNPPPFRCRWNDLARVEATVHRTPVFGARLYGIRLSRANGSSVVFKTMTRKKLWLACEELERHGVTVDRTLKRRLRPVL